MNPYSRLGQAVVALGLGGAGSDRQEHAVADPTMMFEAMGRTGSVQGYSDALGLSSRAAWARLGAIALR